jgi:hypothetical protein
MGEQAMKLVRPILVLALIAGATAPLEAQDAKLAALFIVSFTKYVEWPAAPDTTYVITVLGDDPIYDQLKSLAAAGQVEGRTIVVNKAARIENIGKTHILYIAPDRSNQLGAATAKFTSDPTLVVTQKPGLAKEGAGINIITADGKLSFEINAESLKRAGLRAKPLLFKLGKLVS